MQKSLIRTIRVGAFISTRRSFHPQTKLPRPGRAALADRFSVTDAELLSLFKPHPAIIPNKEATKETPPVLLIGRDTTIASITIARKHPVLAVNAPYVIDSVFTHGYHHPSD